ncbi:LysM peptidoglycan-binding domain-containing protein [Vibrio methylphosphonaticus]|uniref:LysM peptidoglycan-binding domain-containing protein n=1 Tax=Vibrio methylphosphonaticus TaxID=2946866 RepID=UPI00202A99CB|nr:LysM domain-containing protein [Vibrio methylphosphonaticus]MCL9776972.1 LysM peptidoglycan-binding domain-containing protein [Vibrio methylphosphonaticus]
MKQRVMRSKWPFILPILSVFLCFSVDSDELKIKPNVPKTYVVVTGDTLWEISALYLHSPWRWPELWGQNQHINNPHLIYPGDRLTLTWVNGKPRLTKKSVEKLSPRIRTSQKLAISGAERSTVTRYLEKEGLVESSRLDTFPVVAGSSRGLDYVTDRDELYIQYEGGERDWGIYRVGKDYSSSDELVEMTEIRLLAEAHTVEQIEGMTTLAITSLKRELKKGDLVIPFSVHQDMALAASFSPQPGPEITSKSVQLLGSLNSLNYAVQGQTVVLNVGALDSVKQGSTYLIKRRSEDFRFSSGEKGLTKSAEPSIFPNVEIGQLMVIRPYAHFSIAVITTSTEPVSMMALIEAPAG